MFFAPGFLRILYFCTTTTTPHQPRRAMICTQRVRSSNNCQLLDWDPGHDSDRSHSPRTHPYRDSDYISPISGHRSSLLIFCSYSPASVKQRASQTTHSSSTETEQDAEGSSLKCNQDGAQVVNSSGEGEQMQEVSLARSQ